ncbi:hypothetical protein YC2023_010184 [Brassica napus]
MEAQESSEAVQSSCKLSCNITLNLRTSKHKDGQQKTNARLASVKVKAAPPTARQITTENRFAMLQNEEA